MTVPYEDRAEIGGRLIIAPTPSQVVGWKDWVGGRKLPPYDDAGFWVEFPSVEGCPALAMRVLGGVVW